MSHHICNAIVTCIKKTKYYSMFLNSIWYEGYAEQLAVVFHIIEGSKPVERLF